MSRARQAVLVFGIYLLLAVILHAAHFAEGSPATVPPPGRWPHDAVLNAFLAARNAPALTTGGVTAWLDTGCFHPQRDTLLLTEPLLGFSFLDWPLVRLGLPPLLAHNLLWLLALAGNGLGIFLLVRGLVGGSGVPLVAGLPIVFGSYAWSEGPRLQIMFVGVAAVALLCLERLARDRRRRDVGYLALAIGAQLLLSLYLALFLVTAMALWLVLRPLAYGWREARVPFLAGALALAVAVPVVMTWPLLGRYLDVREDLKPARLIEEVARTSVRPEAFGCVHPGSSALLGAVIPCGSHWTVNEPHFPGVLAVGLLIGGLALAVRPTGSRLVRHHLLLLTMLGVLMLGPTIDLGNGHAVPGPYRLLARLVPGWKGVRLPGRLHSVAGLSMALVIAAALGEVERRGGRRMGRAVLLGAAAITLAEVIPQPSRYPPPEAIETCPTYAAFLRDAPEPGAVVELPTKEAVPRAPMRDTRAMLASLIHHRRVVNGHFSLDTPAYLRAVHALDTFPSPASLAMARELGVRFVVVHEDPRVVRDARASPGIARCFRDGASAVYAVK
ncbi:MAG TPA: hypothetical protein PLS53_02210 [Thermoanaerobaculaceae bacterium]|nr:hypothetical protein [Thermoanaerobaculaceae bacterium]HPS76950.1 hypothetical protein [Thermoanaerobaculaceae bacterium]